MVLTTGAISRAKLQSNRHHQQTDSFLQAGCPSCCPTNSVEVNTRWNVNNAETQEYKKPAHPSQSHWSAEYTARPVQRQIWRQTANHLWYSRLSILVPSAQHHHQMRPKHSPKSLPNINTQIHFSFYFNYSRCQFLSGLRTAHSARCCRPANTTEQNLWIHKRLDFLIISWRKWANFQNSLTLQMLRKFSMYPWHRFPLTPTSALMQYAAKAEHSKVPLNHSHCHSESALPLNHSHCHSESALPYV